jgi:hypothetical protein
MAPRIIPFLALRHCIYRIAMLMLNARKLSIVLGGSGEFDDYCCTLQCQKFTEGMNREVNTGIFFVTEKKQN